jgi:hypothetical protein
MQKRSSTIGNEVGCAILAIALFVGFVFIPIMAIIPTDYRLWIQYSMAQILFITIILFCSLFIFLSSEGNDYEWEAKKLFGISRALFERGILLPVACLPFCVYVFVFGAEWQLLALLYLINVTILAYVIPYAGVLIVFMSKYKA